MKRLASFRAPRALLICFSLFVVSFSVARAAAGKRGDLTVQDILLTTPAGWELTQEAASDKTLILGFHKADDYFVLYVKPLQVINLRQLLGGTGNQVDKEFNQAYGALEWKMADVTRNNPKLYLTGFHADHKQHSYFGFSRAKDRQAAQANAAEFLKSVRVYLAGEAGTRSLTSADYAGKKYYFGFSAAAGKDPQNMHNEVKYDVFHTHDIFTKEIGGSYLGSKFIGVQQLSLKKIRDEWNRLKGLMGPQDMYVQYSSSHGLKGAVELFIPPSEKLRYSEIRDTVLSFPAKEIIVFTMACFSGGLVESFNQKKSLWENWSSQGRTLFVLVSSTSKQTSSTGPGKDSDEPGGPNGSAGSAFGHALWKALIGYADGEADGVKDGFLSLEEIRDYSVRRTKQVGGHSPQYTGAYRGTLIMNRVPPKSFLDALEGSTESLSDEEIMERVQVLDRTMRVNRP